LSTAIIQPSQLLNKHTPLKSKFIRTKPRNPWYTRAQKTENLPNVILNVSALILLHLKILDEVSKPLSQSPDNNCDLDPISTYLLKQCSHILLTTITNIINPSISTCIFPDQLKNCSVHHQLKKYNLDEDDFGNYRPISHLHSCQNSLKE